MQKSQYKIQRCGKTWEVIQLDTGRSVGQRYTRKDARKLKARLENISVERRNREELNADVR